MDCSADMVGESGHYGSCFKANWTDLSPYSTPLITVRVGSWAEGIQTFSIHEGILSSCAQLINSEERSCHGVALPDTEPRIFELVSRFLYTRSYRSYMYDVLPRSDNGNTKAWEFEAQSLLYSFAKCYRLDSLALQTTAAIEKLGQMSFRDVLETAKKMCDTLPKGDLWYRDYFKKTIDSKMKQNKSLAREPYIIDVFSQVKGCLTVDLFLNLTQEAIDDATTRDSMPTCSIGPTPKASTLSMSPCKDRKENFTSLECNDSKVDYPKCSSELVQTNIGQFKKQPTEELTKQLGEYLKGQHGNQFKEKLQETSLKSNSSALPNYGLANGPNAAAYTEKVSKVDGQVQDSPSSPFTISSEAIQTPEEDSIIVETLPKPKDSVSNRP